MEICLCRMKSKDVVNSRSITDNLYSSQLSLLLFFSYSLVYSFVTVVVFPSQTEEHDVLAHVRTIHLRRTITAIAKVKPSFV